MCVCVRAGVCVCVFVCVHVQHTCGHPAIDAWTNNTKKLLRKKNTFRKEKCETNLDYKVFNRKKHSGDFHSTYPK